MGIQDIAEEILWDKVSNYIERVVEFQKMIANISYIDHKVADEVERCEIFDSEEINVISFEDCGKKIFIEFGMPFIMSCWRANKHLFRVTAYASGKAVLEAKELIKIDRVTYGDIEVYSVYL